MFSFDLRKEKWIPVKTLTGENIEVSLFDALLKAREYKRIDDQSPLVVASLHRFLLAVLHRALKGPTDIKQNVEWFQNGFPEKEIIDYLNKWGDRFDLFHSEYPFYQVRDLPEEFKKHWHILTSESGSGSTSALYNYNNRKEKNIGYEEITSPSVIAKKIIEHQNFTLGGLIRKIRYSQGSAPSAIFAMMISKGNNLHETYCLNLVSYYTKEAEIDIPCWERSIDRSNLNYMKGEIISTKGKKEDIKEECKGASEPITGITNHYTWISRSIKIIPEIIENNIVIKNILYASGISIKRENVFLDPMVTFIRNIKKGLYGISLDKDKKSWRDFDSLLPNTKENIHISKTIDHSSDLMLYMKSNDLIQLSIYGQSVDRMKAGKIETYRNESFNIPASKLKNSEIIESINESLRLSEESFINLKESNFRLLVESNPKLRSKKEKDKLVLWNGVRNNEYRGKDQYIIELRNTIQKLPSTITYWSTLESHFTTFLSNFNSMSPEDNETWWLEKLKETVNESWQQTCESVGITGDSIKAITMAEKTIRNHLNYLEKLIKGNHNG